MFSLEFALKRKLSAWISWRPSGGKRKKTVHSLGERPKKNRLTYLVHFNSTEKGEGCSSISNQERKGPEKEKSERGLESIEKK